LCLKNRVKSERCIRNLTFEKGYPAYNFELAAKILIEAKAVGEIRDVNPGHGLEARRFLHQESIVNASFERLARRDAYAPLPPRPSSPEG